MATSVLNYFATTTQVVDDGNDLVITRNGGVVPTAGNAIEVSGAGQILIDGLVHASLSSGSAIVGTLGAWIGGARYINITSNGVVNGAIYFASPTNSLLYLNNYGLVQNVIYGSQSGDSIVNYGQINNGLATVGGFDVVENWGTIRGSVGLGSDNDSFYMYDGRIVGGVNGDSGDDRFYISGMDAGSLLKLNGDSGVDTVDFRLFAGAVWVDLTYKGAEVWTQDAQSVFISTNPWRALVDLNTMENIVGSGMSDYLAGDGNNNTFMLTEGLDTINGRGGTDTFDTSSASAALWIDLAYAGNAQVQTQDQSSVNVSGGTWRELAKLSGVETIITTYYNDYVAGDAANNTFVFYGATTASGGYDTFIGRDGTDRADFSQYYNGAVWVNLSYAGREAQTQFGTSVFIAGPWHNLADLATIEDVTGTLYNDYLGGDGFNNRLEGGYGADTLRGGGGADQFVFNLATGQLQTSAERDTIQDFTVGLDKIAITGIAALPGLVVGAAPAAGSVAAALLYSTATGVLSYDPDGNGMGASIEIARLVGNPLISTADLLLI